MSNIADGFGCGTDGEFVRFLGYARRSNSEVQSQCYAALDLEYITEERFKEIYTKANVLERQINAFISYLHNKNAGPRSIKDDPAEYNIDMPDAPDL